MRFLQNLNVVESEARALELLKDKEAMITNATKLEEQVSLNNDMMATLSTDKASLIKKCSSLKKELGIVSAAQAKVIQENKLLSERITFIQKSQVGLQAIPF